MKLNYLETRYDLSRRPKSEYPDKLIQYLMNRFSLRKGMKILEVGSGRGEFLYAFQKQGLICSGVDIDSTAKSFYEGIDISILDVTKEKFPFADNSFDVVYHKSVIEHMYSPEHMMIETHRILKPGGKLIVLTPDWSSQMHVFYEDITHCRPYNITALTEAFEMFEFQPITVEVFRQLPNLWYNKLVLMLAKLLTLMYGTRTGRWLGKFTGVKFLRFAVELMILGVATKKSGITKK
ncbi:MAG: class I SAM-dependent methyltransferase [Bacteroidales bacterium]|nr:class I SAM-dependent methyltransferase [Bacteroidales bacterium]